jgi:glycogen(starch) synthase
VRILTVSNLYPPDVIGGYEIACEQMVQALRRRGHEVGVLTTWPRRSLPLQPGVERSLRLTDWYLRTHRGSALGHVERIMDVQGNAVDSANVAALLRAQKTFDPDVVYLWNSAFVGALGLAGALAHLQVPVVWHLMDAVPRSAVTVGGHVVSSAARLISRRLRARYVVCSQQLLDEIADAGFEFGDRAAVVPNWVEPLPPPRARRWYPTAAPGLRIVAAGQLAPHKGLDLIIHMARRLLDHGRGAFSIDLFGSGMVDHYRRLIREHRLEDHVHLRGGLAHDELVERFWNYDVFLFPTWSREPFAFAPLEAAARGCVPVLSRDCGNAEWCVDGVHGIKVTRDVEALTRVVSSILDGKIGLEALGRRARWVICESFTLDAVADRVERAFLEARQAEAIHTGWPDDAYHLARLAERLALDWAEEVH